MFVVLMYSKTTVVKRSIPNKPYCRELLNGYRDGGDRCLDGNIDKCKTDSEVVSQWGSLTFSTNNYGSPWSYKI